MLTQQSAGSFLMSVFENKLMNFTITIIKRITTIIVMTVTRLLIITYLFIVHGSVTHVYVRACFEK